MVILHIQSKYALENAFPTNRVFISAGYDNSEKCDLLRNTPAGWRGAMLALFGTRVINFMFLKNLGKLDEKQTSRSFYHLDENIYGPCSLGDRT